jgi:malate permease and related proteins
MSYFIQLRGLMIEVMLPIWAFTLGFASQQLGLTYAPLVSAAQFVGQATIPVVMFVLGLTIPWRNLTPRPEILTAALVKLLVMPGSGHWQWLST